MNDPLGFLGNLVSAVVGGVQRFADNIVAHLQVGVIGWLTGALGSAGIVLPPAFDLLGVLDLARQILGLTWDHLRKKAVTLIGEQNVERLEVVYEFIETLVTEGWGGLWAKIMDSVATVRDLVFEGIKSFLLEKIIIAAVTKIASLFSPVGAIVQLVITAWNLFTFLRDQLARIVQVVQSVIDAIGDIARGVLEGAIAKVESVLGSLLPIAIDLLARLLGLGNVGARVKEIVEQIRAMVDKAVDALIQRTVALFKGGGKGVAAPGTDAGTDTTMVADAGVPSAEEADSDTVTETFRVPGEEHILRAVVAGDEAVPEMASGEFHGLVKRVTQLTDALDAKYRNPKDTDLYVGDTRAAELKVEFRTIVQMASDLVMTLGAAKAPPSASEEEKKAAEKKERKIVADGFVALRHKFEGLDLVEELDLTKLSPGHGPKPLGMASWGRSWGFQVNPLSVASLGKGQGASGPVPGWKILPFYERGHLVANSLGGPGGDENLVPMSGATNRRKPASKKWKTVFASRSTRWSKSLTCTTSRTDSTNSTIEESSPTTGKHPRSRRISMNMESRCHFPVQTLFLFASTGGASKGISDQQILACIQPPRSASIRPRWLI